MEAPDRIFIDTDLIAFHVLNEKHDGDTEYIRSDLATLTIDDIEAIHTFLYAIKNNKTGAFTFTRLKPEQYEEVLRRFNAIKGK